MRRLPGLTTTLLDPSESLQISLQIPVHHDDDWNLWLEACHQQLSAPLRDWLQSLGVERSRLSRSVARSVGWITPLI